MLGVAGTGAATCGQPCGWGSLRQDMHRIYCRLLEEERPKRANQGVWVPGAKAAGGICLFSRGRAALRVLPQAGSAVRWIAASLCC